MTYGLLSDISLGIRPSNHRIRIWVANIIPMSNDKFLYTKCSNQFIALFICLLIYLFICIVLINWTERFGACEWCKIIVNATFSSLWTFNVYTKTNMVPYSTRSTSAKSIDSFERSFAYQWDGAFIWCMQATYFTELARGNIVIANTFTRLSTKQRRQINL